MEEEEVQRWEGIKGALFRASRAGGTVSRTMRAELSANPPLLTSGAASSAFHSNVFVCRGKLAFFLLPQRARQSPLRHVHHPSGESVVKAVTRRPALVTLCAVFLQYCLKRFFFCISVNVLTGSHEREARGLHVLRHKRTQTRKHIRCQLKEC